MINVNIENEKGRSMIEMLGVLAIIGVLSVGGIAGYSKAMQKYRINKTIEQITLIAGNVRAFFAPQKNYIGVKCSSDMDGTCDTQGCVSNYGEFDVSDGCPVIKKAKIFPDEMITVTDGKIMSINNPFGGGLSLYEIDKVNNSADNKAFTIDLYNIPEEACIELATYDWTVAGASLISFEYAEGVFVEVPLDLETAVQQCSESYYYFGMMFDIDKASWLRD